MLYEVQALQMRQWRLQIHTVAGCRPCSEPALLLYLEFLNHFGTVKIQNQASMRG